MNGRLQNIGVSNFTLKIMKEFLPKVKVKPAVLQIEVSSKPFFPLA